MNKKSIFKYAAEAGVPVGIYLSMTSACLLLSLNFDFLPSLLFLLVLGFPFFLGYFMRRIGRLEPDYTKFSSLWLGGIYSVIFGTLICLLLSALYVINFDPGFVNAYVANAIQIMESSPMAADYGESLDIARKAIESRILPSTMEFLTSMAWLTCFAGSVVALFLALILSRSASKAAKTVRQ